MSGAIKKIKSKISEGGFLWHLCVIGNASSKPLTLIFNFAATGGQTYELVAVWDNTSGTNNCSSDLVTVVRP